MAEAHSSSRKRLQVGQHAHTNAQPSSVRFLCSHQRLVHVLSSAGDSLSADLITKEDFVSAIENFFPAKHEEKVSRQRG